MHFIFRHIQILTRLLQVELFRGYYVYCMHIWSGVTRMDIPIESCNFFFLKIYRNVNLFGKIDWSMNSGRRWAGNSKVYQKNYFYIQNSTKNCNKVGTIYKVGTLLYISAFKLSKQCYHFCQVLKFKK